MLSLCGTESPHDLTPDPLSPVLSLFPSHSSLQITKATCLCLCPIPTCLRTFALLSLPSLPRTRSPSGGYNIRQENILTDLIITGRVTEKEEKSLSRRNQGQIDLKLEAGKGSLRWRVQETKGRKSFPGRGKSMFKVSVIGRNVVIPESQLAECKGLHYSKNNNSFLFSNMGLKPAMCWVLRLQCLQHNTVKQVLSPFHR